MAYYLDIFSPTTYESFSKSSKDVAGVREGHASYAAKLRPGDKLICYLTKLSRWVGVLEVQSGVFRDETPRFHKTEDPYVVRVRVKPYAWLEKEKAIPIREDAVWDNLSLTKGKPKTGSRWTGPFRSSLNKLSNEDGKFLEDIILSQVQKGKHYPVDEDEYKKYLTQKVRSAGKDIDVSIPEDNGKDRELKTEDPSVRESIKVQALLARVGEQMGFKIWIATGDKSRIIKEWTPGDGVLLDRLPISFDEVTLKTIERIDVLWIKRRAIVRAFEVEHKTSILLEAILTCREKIQEFAEEGTNQKGANRLFDLVGFFKDNVKVVRLNVSSDADAYTVFETLNDRGLDLSVLDLVKNHIFGKVRTRTQTRDVQSRWTQMIATLSNVPADDFLKVWWTSRRGRIQTAQLFPRFTDLVPNGPAATNISQDLLDASEIYAALELADDPIWAGYSTQAKERVRTLRLLGARQTRPILLSALEKFNVREMERLLHLLEVLIVRYQLIGGGRTGRLEISSARVAHEIYTDASRSANQARNRLRDILPNDEEFRAAFLNKQERNNKKVKYLLSELEIQAARAQGQASLGDELGPLATLTVEHIFPKSPRGEWADLQEADPTLVEEGIFKIGNMCLLTEVNRRLGNSEFENKKETFGASRLLLTNMLAANDEWNREAIEARQAVLADYATAYWRFN